MASTMNCISLLLLLGLALVQKSQAQQLCTPFDEDALLVFKSDLSCNDINNPSIPCPLDDWVPGTDCCQWGGVQCDASHRVTSLIVAAYFRQPMTFQLSRASDSASFGRSLPRLTELQDLEFDFINLDTYLPPAWGSITKLRRLSIYATSIYGEIPREFGKLSELTTFTIDTLAPGLFGFGLSGKTGIPRELCKLSKLKNFVMRYHPNLSGGIPDCIDGWRSIENFQFFNGGDENGRDFALKTATATGLTGVLPASLGNLKNLRSLNLAANSFGGLIPRSLGYLTSLETVNLAMNRLTGEIPAEFGNLKSLTHLFLYKNRLFGEIPNSLGKMTAIEVLDVASNGFYGPIPDRMYNLPNMHRLRLDDNRLWGPLPRGDYLGRNLAISLVMNVSWNFLDGPLNPRQLPKNIYELRMSTQNGRMAFTGISPTIRVLKNLRVLDLSHNQLTGELPTTFNDMPNLEVVDLSINDFHGKVPSRLKAINANLSGNTRLVM
ncbi:hypothetical protein Mapa_006919 [Marchantia paleacea]|nr:hypothetical protein Mapa_006919 [Marchantia paleacea]